MLGGVPTPSRTVSATFRFLGRSRPIIGSAADSLPKRALYCPPLRHRLLYHRTNRPDRHCRPHTGPQLLRFLHAGREIPERLTLKMEGAPTIQLEAVEEKLVSLLAGCCDWLNAHHPQPSSEEGGTHVDYGTSSQVEARIAGGWVRDKLLGLPSHDLDISLSVMTGLNFAILFKQYLLTQHTDGSASGSTSGEPDLASEAASAMSRITKISANPDQSKNLETATANILGLSLDFVNLRKEIYQGDSRIPIMSFGTPKEDAERRDICLNSLFFNVKTRQVEDWTQKGLTDLRDGLIRTPLPPLTTFLDDPLRVLRCVRFASRLNYRLDVPIVAHITGRGVPGYTEEPDAQRLYAEDPRLRDIPREQLLERGQGLLRDALMKKVSRERVGIEVDKMMGGPNQMYAHFLLSQLGLHSLVFHPDASLSGAAQLRSSATEQPLEFSVDRANEIGYNAASLIDELSPSPWNSSVVVPNQPKPQMLAVQHLQIPQQLKAALQSKETIRHLNFAAALLPLRDVEVEEKKGKWSWAGERVLMQGLKLGKQNTLIPVQSYIRATSLFTEPATISPATRFEMVLNLPDDVDLPQAALVALLLRDKSVHNSTTGVTWQASLLMSLVADLVQDTSQHPGGQAQEPARAVVDEYAALVAYIEEHRLAERIEEKVLLDGKALLTLLDLKPSPLLPKIQNALLIWQLSQPAPSSPGAAGSEEQLERAKAYLLEAWKEGKIVRPEERERVLSKGKDRTKSKGRDAAPEQGRNQKRQKSEEK